MKSFLRTITLLLICLTAFPLCSSCKKEETATDVFTPVLRFAVASDVHLGNQADIQDERLVKLYQQAYAYAASQESYQRLDGVFFAGDLTGDGGIYELRRFFDILDRETREETRSLACMGNHEFASNRNTAVSNFLEAAGYESADQHITIGDYHFILMSPSGDGTTFDWVKQQWLEEQLQIAAADDKTGKRPIFVFQHQHVSKTVYGSMVSWGVGGLKEIFSKYPQVVDFSGHSHFPINDPRSIWQGSFTALNTATLSLFEMDLVGRYGEMIFATDTEGSWREGGYAGLSGAQYYIVEVGKKNDLRIMAFDIDADAMIIEPIYLSSVGDPAAFTYTDDRKNAEILPAFAADAKATPLVIGDTFAKFSFPQTINGTYVQNYRCEVYRGDKHIWNLYRLACGFITPTPATLTLPITKLTPETTYTVKIIPVTAFGNEGAPLIFDFTTAATLESRNGLAFSAAFFDGNTAKDSVLGTILQATGNPTTVFDESLDKYVGVFDGSSAFEFHEMEFLYPTLEKSVSFEAYLKINERPAESFVNPFSNQQGGGYGFEYTNSGQFCFYINIGGTYYSVDTAVGTGEWFHAVGTFDGRQVKLYINGTEVAQVTAIGLITMPGVHYLSIGGDSEETQSGHFTNCVIATANIYAKALDDTEIHALYNTILEEQ